MLGLGRERGEDARRMDIALPGLVSSWHQENQ
jgi:hypothetical protein